MVDGNGRDKGINFEKYVLEMKTTEKKNDGREDSFKVCKL